MEIRKFEINGRQAEFVNESRGTRSGFAHDTHLFINGYNYGEATCHYLNRTWERYTYQTVMLRAVDSLEEEREARLKREFKAKKGYTNLTAKRQVEFAEYLEADEDMQFYKALKQALR